VSQEALDDLEAQLEPALRALLPIEALLTAASRDQRLPDSTSAELRKLGIPLLAVPQPDGLDLDLRSRARVAMLLGKHLAPLALVLEAFLLAPSLAQANRPPGDGGGGFKVGEKTYLWLPGGAEIAAVDSGDTIQIVDLGGTPSTPSHGVDAGQGLYIANLDDARVVNRLEGQEAAAILRAHRCTWLAHGVGVVDGALAMSIEYTSQREQFGRPLASFQAVAHKLAAVKVVVDSGRAAIARLAGLIEAAQIEEADRLAIEFSHRLPENFRIAIEETIQVHGGMGFTWEYGLHLRYRRVLQIQAAMGGSIGSANLAGERYLERLRSQRGARVKAGVAP
jgi:alkylation response protein AidB-like acyl-CoA dehydrogenase